MFLSVKGCVRLEGYGIISVMQEPSLRSRSVGHFLVMEILERAQALEASGEDIVHLEVGEPDLPSPSTAVEAGVSAIRSGRTHYTHSMGILELREKIAETIATDYAVEIDPQRVIVTLGSSSALMLAFAALLDPGDELLFADPGYACYPNIARALGGIPRPVRACVETGFTLDPTRVSSAISSRTKGLVVNSPSNPTGTITPPRTLEALSNLGVRVVSDEIYHGLTYEGTARSILEFDEEAFCVGGLSKRYAMTGWRLGYLICPREHVRVVQAMQQNLFVSASDFGQWAALSALDAHDEAEDMRRQFDERRRFLLDALPGVGLPVPVRPQGAFYVFADASAHTDDSMAFAIELLEGAGVAVAPGTDFGPGGAGYIRLSYATSLESLKEGIRRLERYLHERGTIPRS